MDRVQQMKQEQQYEKYVKQKTPKHNVWANMFKAFLSGGTICFLGQVIYHYCEFRELSRDDCSGWTSLTLVLIPFPFPELLLYLLLIFPKPLVVLLPEHLRP